MYAWRTTGLQLRLGDFGRIMLSGAIMAAGVLAFLRAVPGAMGMFGAIALGATLWMIALRVTRALKPEDASRFLSVGGQFPAAMRAHWNRLIGWVASAGGGGWGGSRGGGSGARRAGGGGLGGALWFQRFRPRSERCYDLRRLFQIPAVNRHKL